MAMSLCPQFFLADPVYILGNAAGLTPILAVRAAVRAKRRHQKYFVTHF